MSYPQFNYPTQDSYVKRSEIANFVGEVLAVTNKASGGTIGTAATTVDIASTININQTTAGQTLTMHDPTDTATDKTVIINNVGTQSFTLTATGLSITLASGLGQEVQWTGAAWSAIGGGTSTASGVVVAGGKTFTASNTLTLAGTDGTTMTFPSTSATMARTDAANTFTGHQTIEGVTSTGATGTGAFVFATSPTLVTPVLGVATGTSLAATGAVTSSGATAGMGYATGAGGTVTQLTDKTTGVTLNKVCGTITTANSSLAGAANATFTVTNSTVAATDVIRLSVKSGASTGLYTAHVTAVGAGSFNITVQNIGSTASEAVAINFAVQKSVAS